MNQENVRIITELDKICRTCLAEKDSENLRSLYENSLDSHLLGVTTVNVIMCLNNFQLLIKFGFRQTRAMVYLLTYVTIVYLH